MKKIILVLVLFLSIQNVSNAQVKVGKESDMSTKDGVFEPEYLDYIKNTTTAFIYRKMDIPHLENWKKVMKEVWTYTPVEFVPIEKLSAYSVKPNYSIFALSAIEVKTQSGTNSSYTYHSYYFFLELYVNATMKNGKKDKLSFCKIELVPTNETLSESRTDPKEIGNYIITKATFANLLPGLLKFQLKLANDYLVDGKTHSLYPGLMTKSENIKALKESPVYFTNATVPRSVKFVKGYEVVNKEESTKDSIEFFKSYPYEYEIITAEELNDKIINNKDEFYYVPFFLGSKVINVVNSKTGEILFSKKSISLTGMFGKTDLLAIVKAIDEN